MAIMSNNVLKQKKSKTTKGRQKIEIKKLEKKSCLQVTFSKRRCGLFKKAMELSVLCGVEVGIVVFSPYGKMFVIGQPNFDTVLKWYLNGESPPLEISASIPSVEEHAKKYEEMKEVVEKEKKKGKVIEEEKDLKRRFWWEVERIDQMGLEEVEEYEKRLQKMKSKVVSRIDEMTMMSQYIWPQSATGLLGDNNGCVINDGGGSSSGIFDLQFLQQLLGDNNGCVMDGGGNSSGIFDLQFSQQFRF